MRGLGRDALAISLDYSDQHDLALGDQVTVQYPDGVSERRTVGAIYGSDSFFAGRGVALPRDAVLPHTSRPVDVNMLINLADGVTDAEGEAAVQRVADRFGAPDVETNQEYADAIGREINALLAIIYALLVIAIAIAIMGIANTLALSIHERTRELGLLRAVGQTQRQMRAMVRAEAVIVSLYGTIGGLGLGVFLGWAALPALSVDGSGSFSFALPTLSLLVTLALGALAGVLAAARPARRAARLDVLEAIATE